MRRRAILAILGSVAAYGLSLARLARAPGSESGDSLATMLIYGVGFSAVAWLVSIGPAPPAIEVRNPPREIGALVAYLAAFAVAVLGGGLSATHRAVPREPFQSLAIMTLKLATMVALPAWIFTRFGHTWRELLASGRFDARAWRSWSCSTRWPT